MDEAQIRVFANQLATRIQTWIINALKDDPVAQRVEARRESTGGQGECPFDVEDVHSSVAPSEIALSPVSLVPNEWKDDLETIFGIAGAANSTILDQIGLCIRRNGLAATNYAIGQALRNPRIRGSKACRWIWATAEGWKPEMMQETRPQKIVRLRDDAYKTLDEHANGVF